MRRLALLSIVILVPSAVHAQQSEAAPALEASPEPAVIEAQEPEPRVVLDVVEAEESEAGLALDAPPLDAPPLEAPPAERSLESRYVDTLAGSWAAGGAGIGIGGLLGSAVFGLMCLSDGYGCLVGLVLGPGPVAGLGLLIGTAIGSTMGAGLDAGLGMAAFGLGLASGGVVFMVGSLLGAAFAELNPTGAAFEIGLGMGIGVGSLAVLFLTPLYAALFAADARIGSAVASLSPYVAPSHDGGELGLVGAF